MLSSLIYTFLYYFQSLSSFFLVHEMSNPHFSVCHSYCHEPFLGSYLQLLYNPELLRPKDGKILVAGRMRGTYLLEKEVDRALEGVLAAFNIQLSGQERLVNRYGALSPAVVTYQGLTALAGTGVRRHLHFQRQIDAFHRAWRDFFEPKILNGIAVSETDLDRMPAFVWTDEDPAVVRTAAATGLLQLLVPAATLAALGVWRLRRYSVV